MTMLCSSNENFLNPGSYEEQLQSENYFPSTSYSSGGESTWFQQDDSWCSTISDDSEHDSGIFISGNDVVLSTGNVATPTATATMAGRRSSEIATSQILTELNQAQIHDSIISSPSNWHSNLQLRQADEYGYNDIEVSEDEFETIQEGYFTNEDFRIMDTSEPLPGIDSLLEVSNLPSCNQQQIQSNACLGPAAIQTQHNYDHTVVKHETSDEEFTDRSRQDSSRKLPILSQFLVEALEKPDKFSHMIRWIDRRNGVFEFNSQNKEEFAKLWGVAKHNRCPMTYQKMSRALRIYIKKEIVLNKMRRKLQYVFRPDFLKRELERRESLMST